MIKKKQIALNALPLLILLITITSVNAWSIFPLSTFITWLIYAVTIWGVIKYKNLFFNPSNKKDYRIVSFYFIWMFIGVVRGMFVASGYWEWKQWVSGSMSLALPIFVYVFSVPWILSTTLKKWLKYAIPIFLVFYAWTLANRTAYQFFLGPVFIIACFYPIIPTKKWRYILIGILLFLLLADIGARSQIIKTILAILIVVAYVFSKYITAKVLKISFVLLIISPIVLLYLGITGQFNVFRDLKSNNKNYMDVDNMDNVNGAKVMSDTRTFIYREVIISAIKNNYILFGRTPARGNDSTYFGKQIAKERGTDKIERHKNELCFLNVFTWLGLVGMLLYCAIYIKAAYLSLYKSRNIFVKLVGVFIAFHFAYGWVEDVNNFDILSVSLWMMIAIGFSSTFRNMNDKEFKQWFQMIFAK